MKTDTKFRTFLIIIITQTFSILGSQMSGLAVGIKVFNDTNQATPLALVAVFGAIPRLLSANLAGILADRWNRKKVMILSDVGQAVATLFLLISFASGAFELWHLYVTTILSSVFGIFQSPAFSATVTMLVPDEKRDLANTIQQLQGWSAGIIAPIIAAILFVTIGVTGVLVIDLLTFLVAVGILSMVTIPQPKAKPPEAGEKKPSVWQDAWSGFQFLIDRPALLYVILYATFLNFLFNMSGVLFTPYILTLTGSETTLGILMGIMSAGPIVGGVLFSMWKYDMKRVHIYYPGIIFMAMMLVLLGIARSPIALGIVMFLALFPNPAINAILMSLLQVKTPPEIQGRVFAVIMQLAMLATPLAYLIAGPLADNVLEPAVGTSGWSVVEPLLGSEPGAGMGLLMVINGLIMIVVGLLIYRIPMMRQLEERLPDYIPEVEGDEPLINEELGLAQDGELAPA